MDKAKLVQGTVYELSKYVDGSSAGTEVIFKWFTKDGKYAICSPVGEPDMQSCLCVNPETELKSL